MSVGCKSSTLPSEEMYLFKTKSYNRNRQTHNAKEQLLGRVTEFSHHWLGRQTFFLWGNIFLAIKRSCAQKLPLVSLLCSYTAVHWYQVCC